MSLLFTVVLPVLRIPSATWQGASINIIDEGTASQEVLETTKKISDQSSVESGKGEVRVKAFCSLCIIQKKDKNID